MKFTKGFIFLAAISIIFISCEKDGSKMEVTSELEKEFPTIQNVKVVDGRLLFEDKNSFDEAIETLFQNQENLDNFENQFSGFTSARMAFDQLVDDINNKYDKYEDDFEKKWV